MAGIKIGSAARIEIGIEGESGTRPIVFDAAQWMERLPGCEAVIVGVRADGQEFTAPDVQVDRIAKTIIWTPTAAETIEGEGEAQLLWMDGERIAKKAIMTTVCYRSLKTDATVPDAPEPTWGQKAIEAMQRAQDAAAKAEAAKATVTAEKESALEGIANAEAAALGSIEQAKGEALEEIEEGTRNVADAIIPTEDGEVIALSDSAARPLRVLTIYGRTTQNGTPSPEVPIALESVGADGNVKVSSGGKNLYNPDMLVFGKPFYNTDGTTQSTSSTRVGLIPVEPNTEYTVTAYGSGYIRMAQLDANKVYIRRNILNGNEEGASVTITTDANAAYMQVAADRSISKAQIEKGSVATEYEQDEPKTATITTASGLPGVPVTSGGNYTDANGQQRIADTGEYNADKGTGKYVKRVNLVRLTSTSHAWATSSNLTGRYSINNPTPAAMKGVAPMCTAFPGQVNTTSAANRMYINAAGTQLVFNTPFATVDEWKAYLDANEIYLAYAMAEPIETDLSAEDLASLAALHTHYPNTTIYNSDGAHMSVKYIADTKLYIDNAVAAAITAAMTLNQ